MEGKSVKKKPVSRKRSVKKEQDDDESPVPSKKLKTEIKKEDGGMPHVSEQESLDIKGRKAPLKSKVKTEGFSVSWNEESVISNRLDVPVWATTNVVKLLDEGCTIPFIARYRKEQTGGMEANKLRDTLTLLEDLRAVENKVKSVKQSIEEKGKLTKDLETALSNSQTLQEVETLYAPFKPGNKGTLAERARALGLQPLALKYISGRGWKTEADAFIKKDTKGLQDQKEILEGVKHIIADIVHKDPKVMETVRNVGLDGQVWIYSCENKGKRPDPKPGTKPEPTHKYELYFNFQKAAKNVQPHQILAINRGETHKILAVKLEVPKFLEQQIISTCCQRMLHGNVNNDSRVILSEAIDDAYNRLILPQIQRNVRSNLTKQAEKSSIEVFAKNLKNLLLQSPLKGHAILAIDPGFSQGCKVAVISQTGQVLATDKVFPFSKVNTVLSKDRNKLENMIVNHKVSVVAIGNGVACRETETFVSDMIKKLFPDLKYCIVSESGASIYSVSDIAQKEMPELDPSLRGAVSIGRRLQDPLAELVKVDPKHIGVGQYQHDMPQNQLKVSLDSTVEECVSFVGVDLNTCSECLLSRVSGLSAARAKKVLEWREKFGPFICREQLMSVKGLGAKTYEQAAGFVRIHTLNPEVYRGTTKNSDAEEKRGKKTKGKRKASVEIQPNPLDMTWIHPESYHLAHKFVELASVTLDDIGQKDFINRVNQYLSQHSVSDVSSQLGCGEPTVNLIADALRRPLTYDLRDEFDKPLFKKSKTDISKLKMNDQVSGKVSNVTHFGAFVDIGVGNSGLVHTSQMFVKDKYGQRSRHSLQIGEMIQATIVKLDLSKGHIGLKLVKVL
ncbi:S1 RNA-binding domain-containing protein 1-like [Mya arenaria]|uniref:S1 RNA-binding domain-containing protein 1-like n=1 Tax=Mya arenaria TaxID=6604 RepID=UPI0022E37FC5|nr:S1 RNA-binding domain-containing protein 1-like [Mya arenaria]XP_052766287.1 S1 RNA-binding domain-containing protein 1-like [Mya arenaria]